MHEPARNISPATPGQSGPVHEKVPATKSQRDRLLRIIREYVAANKLVPPLSFDELRVHSARVVELAELGPRYRDFAAVLISNETSREMLAAVAFEKRLLLLPKCFRSETECPAPCDSFGLVCRRCGRCLIRDLQAEAESLGYAVMVAEGSPVVMAMIESGRIEAVVGVSCLDVLERVFPYMAAAAVPGIAIPLLQDGCVNTSADLDWVYEAIYLSSGDDNHRLDPDALRAEADGLFTPDGLARILGPVRSETERISRDWLAKSGKRWRPFLTMCTHQAFNGNAGDPPCDDLRRIAVAVECFHKASLVHDDIEDKDKLRYGEKTLHEEFGVPIALNVGDFLLGEGYRLIGETEAPADDLARMLRVAAEGHRTLCLGQGAELCWSRERKPMSVTEVLDVFGKKTAPAFEVALRLGAIRAAAGEQVGEVLSRYSEALGVAYQIRDDLDEFPAKVTGPSLLLAIAYEHADDESRAVLESAWRDTALSDTVAGRVREIFADLQIDERARRMMESYKDRAILSLAPLDNANLKGLLRQVIGKIFNDLAIMGCCNDDTRTNASSGETGG